ncbi:hypothetical protein SLW70_15655 [Flavobacterium sp. NG2]|uniref:hypothetical protein n=1 Tax=Flavobacterium sp. NG2 TaxID=3097547 RepID=UPI002A831784|nr:hypothetical protein [Flavobacterium sp. NG2]WPR71349.1 hypothetical protein SLW70_15655 [Flavobacterium sp. NG2]
MQYKLSYTSFLFLFLNLLFTSISFAMAQNTAKEVSHQVKILHEGLNFNEKQDCTLIEVEAENGQAMEYYMDVESVICLDHKCKVVRVRLFWDKLGFYNRFELAPGVTLEKTDGIPFTAEDYKKLNRILADKESTLKDYYKNQAHLSAHGSEGLADVDAVTSATSGVDANSIVKGAAWTSCTLWHWANGGVFEVIRGITASQMTTPELTQALTKEDEKSRRFIISELINRKAYDNETVAVVLATLGNSPSMIRFLIEYIEKAPQNVYFGAIQQLYTQSDKSYRVILLNSLQRFTTVNSTDYLNWTAQQLNQVDSFQELQLLLRILDKQKPLSDFAKTEIVQLLKHPQFLIARSAYWFLVNKSVSTEQSKILENFKSKNSDRL